MPEITIIDLENNEQLERESVDSSSYIPSGWPTILLDGLRVTALAEAEAFALSSATSSILNTFFAGIPSVHIERAVASYLPPVLGTSAAMLSVLRQLNVPNIEGPDRIVQSVTVGISGADFMMLLLSQIITSSIRAAQSHSQGYHGPYSNLTEFLQALSNSSCAGLFNSALANLTSIHLPTNATDLSLVLPVCIPNWAAALDNLIAAGIGTLWSTQYYYLQLNAKNAQIPRSRLNQILTHPAALTASASLGAAIVLHGVDYVTTVVFGGNPAGRINSDARYALTGAGLLAGGIFSGNKRFANLFQGIAFVSIVLGWIETFYLSDSAEKTYGKDVINEQTIFWSVLPVILIMTQLLVHKGPSWWSSLTDEAHHSSDEALTAINDEEQQPLIRRLNSTLIPVTEYHSTSGVVSPYVSFPNETDSNLDECLSTAGEDFSNADDSSLNELSDQSQSPKQSSPRYARLLAQHGSPVFSSERPLVSTPNCSPELQRRGSF